MRGVQTVRRKEGKDTLTRSPMDGPGRPSNVRHRRLDLWTPKTDSLQLVYHRLHWPLTARIPILGACPIFSAGIWCRLVLPTLVASALLMEPLEARPFGLSSVSNIANCIDMCWTRQVLRRQVTFKA